MRILIGNIVPLPLDILVTFLSGGLLSLMSKLAAKAAPPLGLINSSVFVATFQALENTRVPEYFLHYEF